MSAEVRRVRFAALVALLAVVGCGTPKYAAPTHKMSSSYAYGAAVRVTTPMGFVDGELLAVESDRVYVLVPRSGIIEVPRDGTARFNVVNYKASGTTLVVWGGLGTATTFSHGFFFILTAPAWVAMTGVSYLYTRMIGTGTEPEAKWARYPQGLPQALRSRIGRPIRDDPEDAERPAEDRRIPAPSGVPDNRIR